jgi:apolipoprotein N-acyltransferase
MLEKLRGAALWLGALPPWRRAGMALVFGLASAFSMAPVYAFPVWWVTLPGLLWLLDGVKTRRGAFALGWCFGFGFFALSLYWVTFAILVDFDKDWPFLPFSITGLPALLALFTGLALVGTFAVPRTGLRVLAFAASWAVAEWLRGHVLTGFPWNLAGYSWGGILPVLQVTAWTGIYGLSLVTVLVAAAPALLLWWRPRLALGATGLGIVLMLVIGIGGEMRLSAIGRVASVPDVRLRLVPGDVPQNEKWQAANANRFFLDYLQRTAQPPATGEKVPNVAIWPETAITGTVDTDPARRAAIAATLQPGGYAIVGAPRVERQPLPGGGEKPVFYNSLFAVDDLGLMAAAYDKHHLVPFGEYLPFSDVLPLGAIAAGLSDFHSGPGPATVLMHGVPPFSPLICYEAIFPGAVTAPGPIAPRWLLNITNDAWFGNSAGPYQHFGIARVRAIETGLPLVRVANAGISAVVDPAGRILASLPLGATGPLDADLPEALTQPTLYQSAGDTLFWVATIALTLICIGTARRRRADR